ncbi:hypothetical protein DITRI_Ditri04bG0044400 [Diplodiscus trichospermus]
MILCLNNSSISCSFATKYFLYVVLKYFFFWGEILFHIHQSSSMYLTYSYLMIFHKVVMESITCTTFPVFNSIRSISS